MPCIGFVLKGKGRVYLGRNLDWFWEDGLVVENMWLDETSYAAPDSRPAISLLQWIQYQLDSCRTVAEVIATDQKLRVESPPASTRSLARVHYLVCDADGDCAAIEFLDGKMAVHRGETLRGYSCSSEATGPR
jgi:penicillin V acylase-like amidase (Ntn superfamily)